MKPATITYKPDSYVTCHFFIPVCHPSFGVIPLSRLIIDLTLLGQLKRTPVSCSNTEYAMRPLTMYATEERFRKPFVDVD